ncbi:hypothetical protein HZS_4291 [Henneguya salminicola]|nr:hypothetical protein HZS_4291 [Henneguya salminicola]
MLFVLFIFSNMEIRQNCSENFIINILIVSIKIKSKVKQIYGGLLIFLKPIQVLCQCYLFFSISVNLLSRVKKW